MKYINKITTGWVTQRYNPETQKFVSQEFYAGDDVSYEDGVSGALINDCEPDMPYLPFDMVDPSKPGPIGTEARVCEDIAQRQHVGLKKYGMTVEANPLPLLKWLQHAYEEALDLAIYLRRIIEEMIKASESLERMNNEKENTSGQP